MDSPSGTPPGPSPGLSPPSAENGPPGRPKAGLFALALAVLTLVAFEPAFDNGFVSLDDYQYVTENDFVRGGLSWPAVRSAFTGLHASNWHPLTWLSHMLDVELFGLEPRGHHLTNVLLHLASVVLLFLFLSEATGTLWRSALATALWAVHPLRVESVAWIAERKDVLSAFFWMLVLTAYLRYVRRPSFRTYLALPVLFALGLMAKPMLVTLPCVLLLLDVWPLRRLTLGGPGRPVFHGLRRCLVEKLPLAALAGLSGVATLLAQKATLEVSATASSGLRWANAAVSYARYLGKTLVPRHLAAYYPFPDSVPTWQVVGAGALLIGLSVLAWVARHRSPAVAVGWCWFLGTLVPVIGVLKVGDQALADRYSYLPSCGLFLALVWGLHDLLGHRLRGSKTALTAAAILIVLGSVALTRRQVGFWADSETLYRHMLAVTERNHLAHLNLAEVLRLRGDRREAEHLYRAALALRPDSAETHAALGQALRQWGDRRSGLAHLQAAGELAPGDVRIRHRLAMALKDLGRRDEAIAQLRAILEIDPGYLQAHWGLGDLLASRGELDEALRHLRAALTIDPGREELRIAIGVLETRRRQLRTGGPEPDRPGPDTPEPDGGEYNRQP